MAKTDFIVGMPRSGTTLVEQIPCRSLPKLRAGGELPTIMNIAAQIAEPRRHIRKRCEELDGRLPLTLCPDNTSRSSRQSPAGAARVTDKMPFNFMHLGLIAALFRTLRSFTAVASAADTCQSVLLHEPSPEELQFASDF